MINEAIHFATKAHEGQVRKVDQSPFIFHPLAVGIMLSDAGANEDTIIAGILHDTVEDTDVTLQAIDETFGAHVAHLVDGCSENKALSWEERKQQTMDALQKASVEICLVTCADKIHNLQASVDGVKEAGKAFFDHFNRGYNDQKWYYGTIKEILETRIPNELLLATYRDLYEKVFGS